MLYMGYGVKLKKYNFETFIYLIVEDDPFLRWSEPGIGRYLFTMSLVGIIGFTTLLVKEYELFKVRMVYL